MRNTTSERRPRILVVGSFVMDQIAVTSKFPKEGQSVIGRSFQKAPGGKGANQAVQAARLGAEVTLIGKIGNDANGEEMLSVCQSTGINIDHVICEEGAASGCAIIILEEKPDHSAANRILVLPGTNMTIRLDELQGIEALIAESDMVMLQLEIPMEIDLHVARLAAAHHVPVMLNPAPFAPIPEELLSYVTYISPNETEAEDISGIRIPHDENGCDFEAARQAAAAIRAKGVENVLITLGSAGALMLSGDEFLFSPSVKNVRSVDPTAAGDSFVSAFCTALCFGLDMKSAMVFANHTAAITVSKMGAMPSLPSYEDVLRGADGLTIPRWEPIG